MFSKINKTINVIIKTNDDIIVQLESQLPKEEEEIGNLSKVDDNEGSAHSTIMDCNSIDSELRRVERNQLNRQKLKELIPAPATMTRIERWVESSVPSSNPTSIFGSLRFADKCTSTDSIGLHNYRKFLVILSVAFFTILIAIGFSTILFLSMKDNVVVKADTATTSSVPIITSTASLPPPTSSSPIPPVQTTITTTTTTTVRSTTPDIWNPITPKKME